MKKKKNMKSTKMISSLLIIFIFISCNNVELEPKSYIDLSQNELFIASSGDTKIIYVTSNCNWAATNTSDWCIINTNKGTEKPNIEVTVLPNKTDSTRKTIIKITDGIIKQTLNIAQDSNNKAHQLDWHTFPVNSITSANYTLGSNGIERIYNIIGNRIFINGYIQKKIYHGNLINNNLNGFVDLVDYPNYTYNTITVGSFVNGKAFIKTFIPSYQETGDLAKEVLQSLPIQNLQFNYNNSPIKYTSYRQLNLLGKGNLGTNLEEIISGHSYLEKEMNKKNGFIYSYNMVLFDLVMDNQEEIITEKITDEKILKNLSCIKSINYGRTAYLLIETDENEITVNNIIIKIRKDEPLTEYEISLFNTLDVYYLHFDNNLKIIAEKGKGNNKEVVKKYMNSINGSSIIPLTFSTQSYSDHSSTNVNYTIVLQ